MLKFLPLGLLAMVFTLALTPLVKRFSLRVGLIDHPGERRVHRVPLPLAGGLGIFASFWLTLFITGHWSNDLVGLLLASLVITITGLIDDKKMLRPGLKLLGQVVAAVILLLSGTRIEFITNPLGGMLYLGFWGIPLTILWIVSVTNIVNFIDGLDGLAAGVVAIACAPMVSIALMMGQPFAAMLAIVLAGSVLGFLPYNFNPARILMGDTGALFLGFLLGAISIEGALKGPTAIALAVPMVALGLPILDTAFAIVRRARAGRPFYQADQGHVHHRLLALGYSQRQAVIMLYVLSGILGATAVVLLGLPVGQAFAVTGLVVLGVVLTGTHLGLQRGEAVEIDT